MMLVIICPRETGVRKLDMQETAAAFYGAGGDHAGFQLATPCKMPLPVPDGLLQEYIASELYEGGKPCGIYTDDEDQVAFSWALLPESWSDVQHIELVILSYGRSRNPV